ncbi:hypothetical protein AB0B25_10275 [Nocardia sp. NPDC049190]|uniref:hypothetical protein n=1 Tax=Nocardia sp. NPDC049190 TaxID=3155650 RepID=UPI0033BFFA83
MQLLIKREPDSSPNSAWDMDWSLRAVLERCRDWTRATRRRHVTVRLLISLLLLLAATIITSGAADAVALAASTSTIDGLSWTGIKDSSGVPLSSYIFATQPSLFNVKGGGVSIILGFLFAIFMVLVIGAIWIALFVADFGWLNWLGKPFIAVADGLTNTLATPLMLVVAVTIGGVFVAVFILRGNPAKAVVQVTAMFFVALSGAAYLANPMADVLSSHGLLAQGRDVGIAVAAGLNGQSNPNPKSIVDGFGTTLADNFGRHPVQVWNLGQVVDDSPSCRAAWTSAVLAGSESQLADGMRLCGNSAARGRIENPTFGQVGTGLVLLIFGTILLVFLAYLSIKIFLAALSSVFHAILAIFGFAAGGFIYGPTQAFLVRNVVGMFADASSMVFLFAFEGGYILVLDSIFRSAPESGIAVMFVGGIVLIAGFVLLRRLDLNLIGGESRISEKIRAILEGRPMPTFVGDTTGHGTLRYALSPGHAIGRSLSLLADINGNPASSWLFRRQNPLMYYSKSLQDMNYLSYQMLLGEVPDRAISGFPGRNIAVARAHDNAALAATEIPEFPGFNARSAAVAVTRVRDLGGSVAEAMSAMSAVSARSPTGGWTSDQIRRAGRAAIQTASGAEDNPAMYAPLAQAAAALDLAGRNGHLTDARGDAYRARAAEEAGLFRRRTRPPSDLQRDYGDEDEGSLVHAVMQNHATYEDFLSAVGSAYVHKVDAHGNVNRVPGSGGRAGAIENFAKADEDTRLYIGNRLALDMELHANNVMANPNDPAVLRAAMQVKSRAMNVDRLLSGTNIGPWTN